MLFRSPVIASAAPPAKVAAAAPPPAPTATTAPSKAAKDAKASKATSKAAATAEASSKVAPPPAKREARKQQDADVALLEAMFHRTQAARDTPAGAGTAKASSEPSVGEQLSRQCGGLSGAAAATCKARICVNNPGAKACHPEP